MFIIKGYNIVDKELNSVIGKIRFSSFSNIFCKNRSIVDTFRAKLERGEEIERKNKVEIVFIMFEITGQSQEGRILNYYMEGKKLFEIAKMERVSEEYVSSLIETYLHGIKI